jgi:Ca2+:H+ antiporter
MLAGGLRHHEQHYNASGARSHATMLILAGIALVMPAAYRSASGAGESQVTRLSFWISLVLLAVYGAYLVFSLVTHAALFAGSHGTEQRGAAWSVGRAAGVLAAATAAIAWMSEILVGAIESSADSLGLSDAFVGVFMVAILGNAAENATAVKAAMKNRMDLSLSIAIGACSRCCSRC